MKTTVTRIIEIDMGHRVPSHKSKCKNLHGHRYRFEVGVRGKVITTKGASDEGMVVDFGDLKEIMMQEIHDPLDHGFMMYVKDPFVPLFKKLKNQRIILVPFIPTAEKIAEYVFKNLKKRLQRTHMQLEYVRVWETPNSSAIYRN